MIIESAESPQFGKFYIMLRSEVTRIMISHLGLDQSRSDCFLLVLWKNDFRTLYKYKHDACVLWVKFCAAAMNREARFSVFVVSEVDYYALSQQGSARCSNTTATAGVLFLWRHFFSFWVVPYWLRRKISFDWSASSTSVSIAFESRWLSCFYRLNESLKAFSCVPSPFTLFYNRPV